MTNYVASSPSTLSLSSISTPENNARLDSLNRKIDEVMESFCTQQKENKDLRDEINNLKSVIQEGVRQTNAKKKIPSELSVTSCK